MSVENPRVLIVAEHASLKYGGEAALPLHYFRVLRQWDMAAWLVVHERTRPELEVLFPHDRDRIHYIADTVWHKLLWNLGQRLPKRLSYFTVEWLMRLLTQLLQRQVARQLIAQHQIDIVHQPMPVSPKEPSLLFGLGVPVVMGPMNGGMDYPPGFQAMQSRWVALTVRFGRWASFILNLLMPGKLQAAALLVSNQRTKEALPQGIRGQVFEVAENGIDVSVWQNAGNSDRSELSSSQLTSSQLTSSQLTKSTGEHSGAVKFAFVGRLVDWKAVDLLLHALQRVNQTIPVQLDIIGDGVERSNLADLAQQLGLDQPQPMTGEPAVQFAGWQSQAECAQRLSLSNALILPSVLECGGAVVLEAMALGLPVIATAWGGPVDYLDDTCGILVAPTSREGFIQGLTDAMVRLASSAELRQTMGQTGQQRALHQFDWNIKVKQVLNIFREILDAESQERSKAVKERLVLAGRSE